MRQLGRTVEQEHSIRKASSGASADTQHLPRLVGKLRRWLGSKPGKASKTTGASVRSSSISSSSSQRDLTSMKCGHAKLRKSCSNDCSASSRLETASEASTSTPPTSTIVTNTSSYCSRRPILQKSNSSSASSGSCRTSPAISDCSRSSLTSSSPSTSSSLSSDKHFRFSDEVLVRDACSQNDLASLGLLLDELSCRNSSLIGKVRQNAQGRTLLHEAANRGSAEMVEMLLRYGSDANAPDSSGDRPLHAAVNRGSYDIAERLLAAGAKVHLFNSDLELPVDNARVRQDHRMVRLLSDAAHSQAAFDCHQARREAGMFGPHARGGASGGRQSMRRPSIDGAIQTLTKAQHDTERARTALRRMASDEPKQPRPSEYMDRRPADYTDRTSRRLGSSFGHNSPVPLLSHQSDATQHPFPSSVFSHQYPQRRMADRPQRGEANISISRASHTGNPSYYTRLGQQQQQQQPGLSRQQVACPLVATTKTPTTTAVPHREDLETLAGRRRHYDDYETIFDVRSIEI